MISAKFRIQLPPEARIAEISTRFPEATFRLLTGYRMDDRAVELGEVRTDSPEEVIEAARSHPTVLRYELLESEDDRVLAKYESSELDLYEFVEQSALPIEFPVEVRDGWFEFDLTGTREELDQLRGFLDASSLPYELESLVTTRGTDTLVTARQRELLEAALRGGYFEVPRECTLADVATTVGIDKSTASTILRRGEARLVAWFLSGPE